MPGQLVLPLSTASMARLSCSSISLSLRASFMLFLALLFFLLALFAVVVVLLVMAVASALAHVLGLVRQHADVVLDVNRDPSALVLAVVGLEGEDVRRLELLALGLAVDVAILVVDQHLLGLVGAVPDLVEVLGLVQRDLAATNDQCASHVYARFLGFVMLGGGAVCHM